MCGIVGYVGKQQAAPLLLDGLCRLEYRGYDSAGVAVCGAGGLQVRKTPGRLKALEELTHGGADLTGTVGIGHTRWATHGEPNDVNAHPHMSQISAEQVAQELDGNRQMIVDITGYQHRVPDAEDVTSVHFDASYADFTTDDPAAVESVISLHRAILEQYDETGERLENQTYLDTEGGPTTCYVRVDYQLRNGTSLCREWRVSIVNGSDIHRLLTQLVSRTDCRESLMGLDVLRKYGGVSNVAGGYVTQYETGAFADLTRQQAQDLVSHALADAANSRAPIDPLRGGMYSSTNLDIEIRMNTNGKTVSLSLSVPDFAVETKAFLDALEFEEPVDGTYDSSTVAVDEILYN